MPAAHRLVRLMLPATLVLILASCGGLRDSRLNPFNWFDRSEARVTVDLPDTQADPRPLVQTVLDLQVEPMPGGAIVRARGLPPTQGWWGAELVLTPVADPGTMLYEFRLVPPLGPTDVNVPRSREVDVAIFVSDYKLQFVNEIVVQGATNARSVRR